MSRLARLAAATAVIDGANALTAACVGALCRINHDAPLRRIKVEKREREKRC
jgi:hypothetical protein